MGYRRIHGELLVLGVKVAASTAWQILTDDFLDALRRVAASGSALDPEVVNRLIGRSQHTDPLRSLTRREREVLAVMAEGHTNIGIARRLRLTDRTVETHISSILT